MKKKIIGSITAIVLATSMVTTALGSQLLINYNGMTQILETTFNNDGTIYIEAEELSELLGLEYDLKSYNREVTLSKNGDTLVMNYDSTKGKYKEKTLKNIPKYIEDEGRIMLPLRFVAETFGDEVTYDTETKRIMFDNSEEYLSSIKSVGKETSKTSQVFTYDQALSKTISNNSAVGAINSAIKSLEANLETTKYSMSLYGDGQYVTLMTTINSLENSIEDSEDTIEFLDTTSELSLISSLVSLKLTDLSIVLLEESTELSKTDLKNTELMYDLGMATKTQVTSIKNKIEQNEISLEQAKLDLKKAKENLNATIGINQDLDIVVEYEPVLENKTFDLNSLVSSARTNSANVISAEKKVKSAQYAVDLDQNGSIFELVNEQPERDLNDAKRALEDAKDQAEQNARTAYNSFEKHRIADESLRIAKEEAVTNYNNLVINYKAGLITKNDLAKAEFAITKAEFDIIQNLLQYNIFLFQLENPEIF